jgi:hypothetical protein
MPPAMVGGSVAPNTSTAAWGSLREDRHHRRNWFYWKTCRCGDGTALGSAPDMDIEVIKFRRIKLLRALISTLRTLPILPAKNEAGNLGPVLAQLAARFPAAAEILV